MMGKAQEKVTEQHKPDRIGQDPSKMSTEGITVAGEAKTDDLTWYNTKQIMIIIIYNDFSKWQLAKETHFTEKTN